MFQRMIILWSTSDETTRVLAFLCISKLLRMLQEKFLEPCIKVSTSWAIFEDAALRMIILPEFHA